MKSHFSDECLADLIRALTTTHTEDLESFSDQFGFVTSNGESKTKWDFIFADICRAAQKDGLKCLNMDHSQLWGFVGVLSEDETQLLLFFNEKTLRKITNHFDDNPIHYLNALLIRNKNVLGFEQQSLFRNPNMAEIQEKQNEIVRSLLGQYADKVDLVLTLSQTTSQGVPVSAQLELFDQQGHLVETTDMSKYIDADYLDNASINQGSGTTSTIPRLKNSVKQSSLSNSSKVHQKKAHHGDNTEKN